MRTVTNTLVLNLAAADILLVLTIPEVAYTRVIAQWKLGNPACKIVPYVQVIQTDRFKTSLKLNLVPMRLNCTCYVPWVPANM